MNAFLAELVIPLVVYTVGYIVSAVAGSVFVEFCLGRVKFTKEQRDALKNEGVEGAGKIIGVPERTLALTFLFVGRPDAIAIIFAAKSIIRFESTKDRQRPFAEYYLVGTLASMAFAVFVGIVTNHALEILAKSIAWFW